MVTFDRREPTYGSGDFWTDCGIVWDVRRADGLAIASLYGVELGRDGFWAHLDVHAEVNPLEAAPAMRRGLAMLLKKFPMVICQTDTGSRMHMLLAALGFKELARYDDMECGADMAILLKTSERCAILKPLHRVRKPATGRFNGKPQDT